MLPTEKGFGYDQSFGKRLDVGKLGGAPTSTARKRASAAKGGCRRRESRCGAVLKKFGRQAEKKGGRGVGRSLGGGGGLRLGGPVDAPMSRGSTRYGVSIGCSVILQEEGNRNDSVAKLRS